MLKLKTNKMRQKGFTFIEIMIVLAIIGIAVGVAVATGNSAKNNSAVTEASQEISLSAAAGQTMFSASRGDYTGISTAVMANSTRLPATMKNAAGTAVVNVFGNNIVFAVVTGAKNTFTMSYVVSAGEIDLCSDIVTQQIKKYTKLTVGSGTINITTVAAAQTACASSQTIKITVK